MKKLLQSLAVFVLLSSTGMLLTSFQPSTPPSLEATADKQKISFSFPYKQAGLSQRQAAAHLISRFSFGARPGDIEAVEKLGVEEWFAQQLSASLADDKVDAALASYESLKMSNEEIVRTYPKAGQVLRLAIKDGVIDKDSARADKQEYKNALKDYMQKNDLKPQAELLRQLANQKIINAAYSNNQLREVLTDFWFNHFNVAAGKGGVQQFVTSYERDVIKPNVLGKFETILLATAKSPAMLTYLDNNKSTANEEAMVGTQKQAVRRQQKIRERLADRVMENSDDSVMKNNVQGKIKKPKMQGLNENYAREIMELHTLGVDGGYTQTDVTQAARVLTGWTLNPEIEYGIKPKNVNKNRLEKMGFVYDDNFLFAANKHDKGEKKVLGTNYPAGGGYEEGVLLIKRLAAHPSTAKFIAQKLAVRFVSDAPPQALVDKMAKTFLQKDGDIKEVLLTMVTAPEFWAKGALREKTKSPFELAISAVRSTDAQINAPIQLYQWISKMGQRLYNYQAPTGFPDKGQYWINTGSLLNRMNFGLALASGRIPGVKINLPALNSNREPESAEEALKVYTKILMPERNVDETVKRLTPLLNDPELQNKLDVAAGKTTTAKAAAQEEEMDEMEMTDEKKKGKGAKKLGGKKNTEGQINLAQGNNSMLGQVVGIIIGSPEFQRR